MIMYRNFEIDFKQIGIEGKSFISSTGGYIKEREEDFVVIEIPKEIERAPDGEYTYFTLVKKGWTTMQAIAKIAKRCHISWKRFSFAGTKDRNGVTTQLVCVKGVKEESLKKIKIKDIEIRDIFYSNHKLTLGDLYGNRFVITVRDYAAKNIKEVLSDFSEFVQLGIPNYFGEQRFGIQRPNNHIVGKLILMERYEDAIKEILAQSYPMEGEESRKAREFLMENWKDWKEAYNRFPKYMNIERMILYHLMRHPNDYVNSLRRLPKNISKIFVYSYQSYIFNRSLSLMKKRGLLWDFELELVGYDSELKGIGSSVVEEILEEEGITKSDFRVASYPEISCRGSKRRTLVFPKEFKVESLRRKSYTVSFILPKGSYATVVMRELIH